MAITQEQYNAINIGDTVTVAFRHILTKEWSVYSGVVEPGFGGVKMVPGFAIAVDEHRTILEHTPKPKPDWAMARVIKTGGNTPIYWVRHTNTGSFLGSNGMLKPVDVFVTDPEIVVE